MRLPAQGRRARCGRAARRSAPGPAGSHAVGAEAPRKRARLTARHAARQVYSEMVGNIMIDAASARKYTHFVRLMGRSASHLTLETALQTHPQAALICEEITATRTTLAGVTQQARSGARRVALCDVTPCRAGRAPRPA